MLKLITPFVLLLIYKPEWNKTILFIRWMVIPATLIIYCSQSSTPINIMLFTDQISNMLVILTLWIIPLVLAARQNIMINKYQSKFTINIISLTLILITAFIVSDLFSFYIIFEASLIPTLFIIIKWGYQPERLQAGLYLIIYTITARLPLLIGIAFQYNKRISNIFFTIYPRSNSISVIWLIINLAFIVKLPLFLFHLWLPKAHVEAPVAGSIILAAVLLKLGGYGILRVIYIISPVRHRIKYYLLGLTLWGGIITRLICVRQQDLKSLIAYSSVGHIRLVIAGVLSNIQWGIWGAISIIIAHGLLSSALFASADIAYSISNSRSLLINKGINILIPTISILWFIISAANMAAPPSANLIAEIILITCSTITSKLIIIPVGIIRFVAAAYSLTIYVRINHGPLNQLINPSIIIIPRNFIVIISHIIPVVLVILIPTLITIY